jgi:hypothetical protein
LDIVKVLEFFRKIKGWESDFFYCLIGV